MLSKQLIRKSFNLIKQTKNSRLKTLADSIKFDFFKLSQFSSLNLNKQNNFSFKIINEFSSSKKREFNPKNLQKYVSLYELQTLEIHKDNQQLHDLIFDLSYTLEQETNYEEPERNLILFLNLGDINLTNNRPQEAKEGLMTLVDLLEDYDKDEDLKSHLYPQAMYRLGAIFSQENNFLEAQRYYKLTVKYIEEYAQSTPESQPISIDTVKLLSKSYEKLGNVQRNMNAYKEAVEYYYRSDEINNQALPPNHPFSLKVKTFLGDTLRKLEQNEECIKVLQDCVGQMKIENEKDSQLYTIATQALGMAYLNSNQNSEALKIMEKTEEIMLEKEKLFSAISFANFYHLKATISKSLNKKELAKESIVKALTIAESVLPQEHQLIQNLKDFKY